MPSFSDFPLQPATQAVLATMKISEPTPVQAEAIPALLAGRDLVGQSATGSGKTLAYGVPLVERLAKDKRIVQALVLLPTRELAVQVNAVLSRFTPSRRLTTALLVGGRPYSAQISALRYGAQIVIGTPGRIKDHLERGTLKLDQLRICVLDEADQMLDSGFAPVIEDILATTPETRQMAFFSATMPEWVAILEKKFLKDPLRVDVTPTPGTQSTIEQIAYQVPQTQKMAALCTLLLSTQGESSLIFGRTKFGVEKLGKQLSKLGFRVGTLHGNKSQRAREDVLNAFRRGQLQTLLATNVAARGLDIQGIYQVINYELPESSELFTHRIGRTGRMGRQGKAITLLAPGDVPRWRRMARSLGQAVTLQQLAIDEEAVVTIALAKPELESAQAYEQAAEPQAARDRQRRDERRLSPGRGRGKAAWEEAEITRERGQESELWPARDRGHFSPDRKRDAFAAPLEVGPRQKATSPREPRRERVSDRTPERMPARKTERLSSPERLASGRARDRRAAEAPSSFSRTPGRRKERAFASATAKPQQRPAARKSAARPAAKRRTVSTKRFAGR
jgi:ATP-dependent RNA helicase DeaD